MTCSDNQTDEDSVAEPPSELAVNGDEKNGNEDRIRSTGKWGVKLRRWGINLAVMYFVILLFLVFAEPYLVYPALLSDDSQVSEFPVLANGFVEKLSVQTGDDVQIDTIHFCPTETIAKSRGVLLVCHGNGEWIDRMVPFLISLGQSFEVSVVCFDYRGYGQSEGFPFEKGILQDADAVYETVIKLGYPANRVIIFGRSIGGGPSCYLASKQEIGGLILHNTFSSLVDVASSKFFWLPIRYVMRNRFDSVTRLKNYQGPLLQSHGTNDRVVPFRFGRLLFDSAATDSSQKEFLVQDNAGHVSPMSIEFRNKIELFLTRILGPRPKP